MSNLGAWSWSQLGPAGLLALAVGLILGGWLVPRRSLRDAQEQRDKWESAWRESSALSRELSGQVAELKEIGHTTTALLQSIVSAAEHPRQAG